MKFLALAAVLLLEQLRPVRSRNTVAGWFEGYAEALQRQFDGGEYRHGVIAWLLAVAPPVLVTAAVDWVLDEVGAALAWAWSLAVLYLTVGFRRFSRYFTEILSALARDDVAAARVLLAEWRGEPAAEFSASEVARVAIEQGLLASHRHVFGGIVWFLVLGPAGALLYRLSDTLAGRWRVPEDPGGSRFGLFAQRFFHAIDWVPARLTALTFAVVGNFEDAIYCWRSQALAWDARTQGVILASGAGALGVRLGDTLHQYGTLRFRPELGTGAEADAESMESTVRLIWRSLVLWMFLLLIVTVAHSLG